MIVFRGQDVRFCLDRHAGQLWRGGQGEERIHLPRKEWELLRYLAENPGKLISKTELQDKVWGAATNISETSLSQAVSKVRRGLGDRPEDPMFIETVQGRGYRFVAEIENAEQGPLPPHPPRSNHPPLESSTNDGSLSWTARGIRLGLKFRVLESDEEGVSLSAKFNASLRDVVREIFNESLVAAFDRLDMLCIRAVLRTHPGGTVSEEDVAYLTNEIYAPLLDIAMRRAASYDLFSGTPEAGFVLSEGFKNEFVDVFLEEEGVCGDRRAACAKTLLQLCEAAALAKGDGDDPTNAKIAMLGVSTFMKGTGILAAYGANDAEKAT